MSVFGIICIVILGSLLLGFLMMAWLSEPFEKESSSEIDEEAHRAIDNYHFWKNREL